MRATRYGGLASFEVYLAIWFSNGIHHHYANTKHFEFSEAYSTTLAESGHIDAELRAVVFDPNVEAKKVEQDGAKDPGESSAVNFYAPDVTTDEAKAYFESIVITTEAPWSAG